MKKSNEKDYLSLTHFLSKILFLGIGISRILSEAKESTIFCLILGTFFGIILLSIITNMSFYKSNKLKKIIMFVLIYILLVIGLIEFINLINSIYLIDTNKFVIVLPLLITIIYTNIHNIKVNLKISSVLLILCLAIIGFAFITLLPEIRFANYFPLFNVSFYKIILLSFEFALYSVVPNILYGGFKFEMENKKKKIIRNYIFSNIILGIYILITQGVLGIELIKLFKYPEYVILKKISLLDFINNIENLLSFSWLFTTYIYLSFCSKILYEISYEITKKKWIYPIFLIISLYIIITYFIDNLIFLLITYDIHWIMCLVILIIYILLNINTFKVKKN